MLHISSDTDLKGREHLEDLGVVRPLVRLILKQQVECAANLSGYKDMNLYRPVGNLAVDLKDL
jgi:hypothetical protein